MMANNAELREFIQEQRKIIASFRSQPWPIQMKMQAIEYVNMELQYTIALFLHFCCLSRNYKENILKYMPQLSSLDAFKEKSSRVWN